MHTSQSTPSIYLASAYQTLKTEQRALDVLIAELDHRFGQACALIPACTGRVVITGMGKSGHIGRKIAATFASTGTPSFFMHPGEAAHGDLGMLVRGDVLIAISNSGQSDEIMMLMPAVQHYAIPLITISKNSAAVLPQLATVALTLGDFSEACPLGLAPTSSTTATLALGDALAVALLETRGFNEADFALSHPAGSLGKKLLIRVSHVMHDHTGLPMVDEYTAIKDALLEMSVKRLGMTTITSPTGELLGIFTDGDLRRYLEHSSDLTTPINQVMTRNPITVKAEMLAIGALELMHEKHINNIVVTDQQNKVVGALHMHDIIQAGVS